MKFYASVRLEVRRGEILKRGTEQYGHKTKIKVVKNKIAPPFKVAEVDIIFGEGISREGELVDLGADFEIVQKSGSWYSYNGERLGQGRDSVITMLKANKELAAEIEGKIRAILFADKSTDNTADKE